MRSEIREITDKSVWDDFVFRNGPWSLFQSWNWGEVEKTLDHKVVRLGFSDRKQLFCLAQTVLVKAKRGVFVHVRQGPVFEKKDSVSEVHFKQFVEYIKAWGKEIKAWFVRVSPMLENSPKNNSLLRQFGFHPAPIHAMNAELCWVLDLHKSEEELLGNMRKTTRYLIRQAEKLEVSIERSNNIEAFMELYNVTSERHRFVKHRGIREEFRIFKKNGDAELLLAKYGGKYLSGALILFFGTHAIYHHGASLLSKVPASYLLQWKGIQLAKDKGMTLYNFWGIAPETNPRHPWRGTTLFKKGFGGRPVEFLHASDLPLSPFYSITYTIETVRKIKRGY